MKTNRRRLLDPADYTLNDLLSVEDAAALIGIDHQTLMGHVYRGNLGAVKVSERVLRIPRAELGAFMVKRQMRKAGPPADKAEALSRVGSSLDMPLTQQVLALSQFWTQQQIADLYGVSKQWINQLLMKARKEKSA